MESNNRVPHCAECDFMRLYDYSNRICYCDHAERIDDMGKLGVDHPPKISPDWCPLRENIDSDLIKMKSDIHLTDKEGNPIEVKSIQPEYISDIFS